MSDIRMHIKEMIVRVLMLEGVTPADIQDDQPLFGEGLGLDSVDALELLIHLEEEFRVSLPDDDATRDALQSVATLASAIEARQRVASP